MAVSTRAKTWILWVAGGVAALLLVAVLAVAMLPVGLFRGRAEAALSARFGRPVTIGALERTPAFSFYPTIRARDIRIPQAGWAGEGDLARIGSVAVRIRALKLLAGDVDPQDVRVSGARLNLVRAADGRENWRTTRDESNRGPLRLDGLTIRDTVVSYSDAKRDRRFTLAVTADDRGVAARGTGVVRGSAVRVALAGPAIGAGTARWPFRASIDGRDLAMSARGTMDAPLDTDRMSLTMTARASDLKLIDAVIEAGLFGTQAVRMRADVRHDGPVWRITNLDGTVGRSDLSGAMTVDKTSGRTMLTGQVRARTIDFDDFADDAGLAKGAALERAIGPRLVPNTRVNIAKIDRTDARVDFRIDRIVSKKGLSALTSARGRLTLDRQLATLSPLTIGLRQGRITGSVTIDQRGQRRQPIVRLGLDIKDSSIAALSGGGPVSGQVDGRIRLTGRGDTIRAAVGRSDGSIGIVAHDGALPAKLAAALGFDAARALTADEGARATLRCAILRLDMDGGRGRFAPLIVDTTASQARGTGSISFPSEAITATLTGAPKRGSPLRVPGSVIARGTLRAPELVVPEQVKSIGNILKGIGRAITGHQGPTATDADCTALTRRAIGR